MAWGWIDKMGEGLDTLKEEGFEPWVDRAFQTPGQHQQNRESEERNKARNAHMRGQYSFQGTTPQNFDATAAAEALTAQDTARIQRQLLERDAQSEQATGKIGPKSRELAKILAEEEYSKPKGPSVAELEQKKNFEKLIAMQANAAASNPAVNAAVAQRMAGDRAAEFGQAQITETGLLQAREAQVQELNRQAYEKMQLSIAANNAGNANQRYAYDTARLNLEQQARQYEEAQRQQEDQRWWDLLGSGLQIGGMALGAYLGGPAGAAVGGQVGSAVGQSLSQKQGEEYITNGGQMSQAEFDRLFPPAPTPKI
jgi:hypothetical protein